MASDDYMTQLQNLAEEIFSIDTNNLLRTSLGALSLEKDFSSTLEQIGKKIDLLRQYGREIHDEQIQNILSILESIRTAIKQQADFSDADYAAHRQQFLDNVKANLEDLKQYWAPVVAAAVEARRFLDDEGVRREHERTIESIKKESETALQQVKEESDKTIEEARTLKKQIEEEARTREKQIEDRARLTAAGISVEEAQKQFREAQAALDKRVKVWAGLGGVCVAGFFFVALSFVTLDLPDEWQWQVFYHSAIKVSILTAIATTAAFCLRILRAHLHMSEKNRHRQRVANSMGAFVESATPEQRDLILSQLVDAIVQFGHSGLVQREDDYAYRPKMPIDSITRTLPTNPQKDV